MELSSLFPVVDERATAKKVKKFFEKDFERLLRLADEQTSFFAHLTTMECLNHLARSTVKKSLLSNTSQATQRKPKVF